MLGCVRRSTVLWLISTALVVLMGFALATKPSNADPANAASAAARQASETGEKPSAEAVEFFEKQVRPILANRCYKCHADQIAEPKGGLRLDSRSALLKGGDTGPAIVPSDASKSLLVDAINYRGDYEMPPKSKLPAAEIDALTRWVAMGAPWPAEQPASKAYDAKKFDLAKRKAEHWAWQPLARVATPQVKNPAWTRGAIDQFVLARLEAAGLAPAKAADPRTLLRRLYFDLIGLPPTPAEVDAFIADASPDAFERAADRLLASPHFGERWARHWLDLVRYAETRGHEFDYTIPNAFEYRDYVIRAFNADLPYDRFVTEQIAGDLLAEPRLHPTAGFNESILGTGFWFLGEAVHSPVDIRKDETDRLDNSLDVMTKTFLGLTVACARCHDHKFDAISQRDYYALAGYLQSCDYRQARFETDPQERRIAAELARLDDAYRPRLLQATAARLKPGVDQSAAYLLAARDVLLAGPLDDPKAPADSIVFENFESGAYEGWTIDGSAFGKRPQTLETIASYQGRINAVGHWFVNSHNIRGGEDMPRGDEHTGKMTSREFRIERDYMTFLIGGGAHAGRTCMNLLVDGKAVLSATGHNSNQMSPARWDVRAWRGKTARLEIVDAEKGGWGNIGVDDIVFTNRPTVGEAEGKRAPAAELAARHRTRADQVAKAINLAPDVLHAWVSELLFAADDVRHPLYVWSRLAQSRDHDNPAALVALLRAANGQLADVNRAANDSAARAAKNETVLFDFANLKPGDWMPDGVAFGSRPMTAGDVRLVGDAQRPIAKVFDRTAAERDPSFAGLVLAGGVENDPARLDGWIRAGRSIRTATFTIKSGKVWALVRGAGHGYAVVDSHRMNNGPLHGQLVNAWGDDMPGRLRWVGWNLSAYPGHRAHIEFSARETGEFAVYRVVESDSMPEAVERVNDIVSGTIEQVGTGATASLRQVAERFQAMLGETLEVLRDNRLAADAKAADRARLADWMLAREALFASYSSPGSTAATADTTIREYAAQRRKLESQIPRVSRTAVAVWEGSAEDELLLVRGNSNTPGPAAPRRFLEAIAGANQPPPAFGSGRLELARQILDRSNPLASRVIANRLWQHLLGRGIVASVDSFGVLGDRPTHPELLDYLASSLADGNWSLKSQIRAIAASSAYRMSSHGDTSAEHADPRNLLWHRAERKRLEGEVIRDAMLAVAGRLDARMFGRSVAAHISEFQDGRGKPASGPLDGDGRRSIYVAVRRNFLSPMMLAFDTPTPQTTVGRRNSSNVPAQALMLLNDPMVIAQAQSWATRLLADRAASPNERVDRMYREAFGRPARADEIADALAFLERQGESLGIAGDARASDARLWTDLCHVMWNLKEFVFVN